jgi:Cdc6-like AAA superfamily ATPase
MQMFEFVDPEAGFTSSAIRDPRRFVGRADLIQDCMNALNAKEGVIAVYGKRGVGKTSLVRQIQQMANGNYDIAQKAGLGHLIPRKARRYYTVYYACDSNINNTDELIKRLCNDTDPEDGLLRLVPDSGKELTEFSRSDEASAGVDLKLVKWGVKGSDSQKYASVVPNDTIQSFRNFVTGSVDANNRAWAKRDGLLLLLDEFDVIGTKHGMGSLIKSLTSPGVKFGVCGIGQDLGALIKDHKSVGRLIEQGAIHVKTMSPAETRQIFTTAEELFKKKVRFDRNVVEQIVELSEGFPYFAQLIGKASVQYGNEIGTNDIDGKIFDEVLEKIRSGKSFPSLEQQYQLAVGRSAERAMLLVLLAEQSSEATLYNDELGRIVLQRTRATAQGLGIEYIDQLMPRLVEERYGPALVKGEDRGIYEFADPVFRAYVKLRRLD